MSNPIYKDLPPIERRADSSLYRMTPAQQRRAKANPKITALQVELAHVDSEIEKLVDSLTFDDKRRVVDLMITTIAATSDSLNITWKI